MEQAALVLPYKKRKVVAGKPILSDEGMTLQA